MFRIFYQFLSALARLAVRSGRSKDLEIIVLRHQLTVLRSQVKRLAIDDNDRSLLGAIAAALPSVLRQGWIVTPETLALHHQLLALQRQINRPQFTNTNRTVWGPNIRPLVLTRENVDRS